MRQFRLIVASVVLFAVGAAPANAQPPQPASVLEWNGEETGLVPGLQNLELR